MGEGAVLAVLVVVLVGADLGAASFVGLLAEVFGTDVLLDGVVLSTGFTVGSGFLDSALAAAGVELAEASGDAACPPLVLADVALLGGDCTACVLASVAFSAAALLDGVLVVSAFLVASGFLEMGEGDSDLVESGLPLSIFAPSELALAESGVKSGFVEVGFAVLSLPLSVPARLRPPVPFLSATLLAPFESTAKS